MPPPNPPEYGEGPVNFGNQGSVNPFDAFGNQIRYNDMVRYQMISQYQQRVVQPATMAMNLQRQIASGERFQYGVQGGQDRRYYNRQAELNRMTYGSTIATTAMDLSGFGIASSALGAMGVGGMMGLGIAALAPMAPMYFINKGVSNAMDRQRFMHSMASDLEQNRERIGLSGMRYGEATQLATGLTNSMYRPGQFFSKEQQSEIHKIAISNDLITAKGRGMDSGTIKQYQRNMEELIKTTEDIVKLLQTTKEGGMSVIKELKQSGFGSIQQIRQQVLQAKAFGGMTGLGAQNMMQIGAAGAAAVQGTPWSATTGAGMYQMGTMFANRTSASGPGGEYAIRRAGGVAAAGGAFGRFALNLMSSGIGTKMAAYGMNSSMQRDDAAMATLLGGDVSGYGITQGANNLGYVLGEDKVRFGWAKSDMLNQMSDMERMKFTFAGFNAWSKERRYSKFKNKAAVFARSFTGSDDEARAVYEILSTVQNTSKWESQVQTDAMFAGLSGGSDLGINKIINRASRAIMGPVNRMGEAIVRTSGDIMNTASRDWGRFSKGVGIGAEKFAMYALGAREFVQRADYGDMRAGLGASFGVTSATPQQSAALGMATAADLERLKVNPTSILAKSGIETSIGKWQSAGNLDYVMQRVLAAGGNARYAQLFNDPRVTRGFTENQVADMRKNPQSAYIELANQLADHRDGINSKYNKAIGKLEVWDKKDPRSAQQKDLDEKFSRRFQELSNKGDVKLEEGFGGAAIRKKDATSKTLSAPSYLPGVRGGFAPYGGVGATVSTPEELYLSTKGISPDVVEANKAALEERKASNMNASALRGAADAAGIKTELDKQLGGAMTLYKQDQRIYTDMSGNYTTRRAWDQQSSAKIKAMKKYGFDIGTKQGRTDLGVALVSGINLQLEGEARKQFGNNGVENIMKTTQLTEAGKAARLNATEASAFTKDYTGDDKKVFTSLMAQAHSGKLNEAGLKTLNENEGYKKYIMGSGKLLGTKEAMNEMWTSPAAFSQVLNKGAPAKESQSELVKNMRDELKQLNLVISGEQKGAVKIKTLDGSDNDISADKWTDMGKREKKAQRLKEELVEKIKKEDIRETTQGPSISSIVRSPVLNYWNNRWVL